MTTSLPTATGQPGPQTEALQRRRELAAFLRSRRERLTPEQLELPVSGRRRTPGLRREELAGLAGVGVTWYTWLEQARDIRVSEQVLDAIARSLRLDSNERRHLFTLAGVTDRAPGADCGAVPPAVLAMMSQLDPYPAAVLNARYDLLSCNDTYRMLISDVDEIPQEDRNLLWLMFTNPANRTVIRDWDGAAAWMVAQFRANMAEHVSEPNWKSLVASLRARSEDFARMWDRHDVGGARVMPKRFDNPMVGLLEVDHVSLWFGQRSGTRLVCYTPREESTRVRLERLCALSRRVEQTAAS
ncbi:MAG: helix-turn-helix transcriptional regulator [Jatrophihabitans sp.]